MMIACAHATAKKFGTNKAGNPRMRCTLCGKTWTVPRPNPLGNMRISLELAERIINQLCEGTSVRATARLTKTNAHTVTHCISSVCGIESNEACC
jgi:transposase-like protein